MHLQTAWNLCCSLMLNRTLNAAGPLVLRRIIPRSTNLFNEGLDSLLATCMCSTAM